MSPEQINPGQWYWVITYRPKDDKQYASRALVKSNSPAGVVARIHWEGGGTTERVLQHEWFIGPVESHDIPWTTHQKFHYAAEKLLMYAFFATALWKLLATDFNGVFN